MKAIEKIKKLLCINFSGFCSIPIPYFLAEIFGRDWKIKFSGEIGQKWVDFCL